MTGSDDIEKLIRRVALRDRAAFRRLYDRTSAKLFGVCLRILNNRTDAEDTLQEVYVKIWNKADRFAQGHASGIAWLAAIARNQAIDLYRSHKPVSDDITSREDIPVEAPSPEATTITNDNNRQLMDCLGELDEKHAAAVKRIYLGGWSYQDTANELGIPLNTAKTWIRRSLLALRDCLNR